MRFYSKTDKDFSGFECNVLFNPTEIEVASSDYNSALYPYICVVEDDKRFVKGDNFMEELIYSAGFCEFAGENYKVINASMDDGYCRHDSMNKDIVGRIVLQLEKL